MGTPVSDLVTAADVAFDVDARSRDELLAAAARFLAMRHGVPERAVFEQLRAREALGSTALGHGFALPHARMRTLDKPVAAFLRTRDAIDCEAPDHRPVRNFLVVVVPAEAVERHLAVMACAARQFADPGFRQRLRAASDAKAVAELFAQVPA